MKVEQQSDEKSFQLYLNYRSSLENISLVDRIWGHFDFRDGTIVVKLLKLDRKI